MLFRINKFEGFIILVIGCFIMFSCYNKAQLTKESKGWPTVEAQVISTNMIEEEFFPLNYLGLKWKSQVTYSYDVAGTNYTKDIEKSLMNHARAEKFIQKYPVNEKLNIHYNPENPDEMVFDQGIHRELYLSSILGIGIVVAGLLLCL